MDDRGNAPGNAPGEDRPERGDDDPHQGEGAPPGAPPDAPPDAATGGHGARDPRNLAAAASGATDQPLHPTTKPADRPKGRPRSPYRDGDGHVWRDLSPQELTTAFQHAARGDGVLCWVDVDSTDEAERRVLPDVFQFHPLAVEDALSPTSRVKVEEFTDTARDAQYLLIVLRAIRFRAETPDDPYDTDTVNLTLFVGRHVLVTVHAEPAPSVDAVVDLVQRNPDLLERGAGRLAHMVCDNAVDAYFPVLDQIDEFIDGLEERVFARFDRTALQEIFRVKRLVLSLRRYLAPQREAFNVLSNRPSQILTPEMQVYFRDVYDHVLRINDSLDTYRELLSGTLDAYLSQVSNQLGQVTKGLSVVVTLSIPFVVISGMWGMNVENIPLSHQPHGFAIMLALQLALGVALVLLLRWRRWL
jgi:magnesium transporter